MKSWQQILKSHIHGVPAGLLYLTSLTTFLLVLVASFHCPEACAQKYGRPVIAENPNLLKQQAFDCYLAGEFEDAANLYKKAIEAGSKEYGKNSSFVADLCYELGTMSLEEGNFIRAERYLPQAVRMKPNSVQARVKLADLYLMQDKLDEAMGQIGTALKRNPGSVEAQRELVKLMMARAKNTNENSEAANLACTWESFQLKNFSNNLVKSTNNLIAQWRKQLNSNSKRIPTLSIAMSTPSSSATPAPTPKKIRPPQDSGKSKAHSPSKPVTKKAAAKKPTETRPRPKPKKTNPPVARVSKPKSTPAKVSKPVVAKTSPRPKRSNGLVPPPPPMVPAPAYNAPPPSTIKLEAKAQLKKPKKEKKKEPPKKTKPKPKVPDEPDFILDWASKKN